MRCLASAVLPVQVMLFGSRASVGFLGRGFLRTA